LVILHRLYLLCPYKGQTVVESLFLEIVCVVQVMNVLDSLRKLTSAIQSGNSVALEEYLSHGGDPNADYGMTLLGMPSMVVCHQA
jgi:hypothetical protein